ncbi:TPA: hypothetical protein N0F65_012990 [Lagenidium giganteum]|uniref:TMEM131 second Ig-like domain-containing protein n=1 Tax=Lagenidium giganteum TaxID=4803 RepID=A0AAV2YDS1_9STRA|nr:TPA: hypothetical protein N0F65_012990 [Lagenidium giganteum]
MKKKDRHTVLVAVGLALALVLVEATVSRHGFRRHPQLGAAHNTDDAETIGFWDHEQLYPDEQLLHDAAYSDRKLVFDFEQWVTVHGSGKSMHELLGRPEPVKGTHGDGDARLDPRGPLLKVTPERMRFRDMPACVPHKAHLDIYNSDSKPVVVNAVKFAGDEFFLHSDPIGHVIAPAESLRVEFVFLPVDDKNVDSHATVFSSVGDVHVPITASTRLTPHRVQGLRATIPVDTVLEHDIVISNPATRVLRVTELYSSSGWVRLSLPDGRSASDNSRNRSMGMWDVHPHSAKAVATIHFEPEDPGVYHAHVAVHTSAGQFLIPLHVRVLQRGMHFEPAALNLGIITNPYEKRMISIDVYNAGDEYMAIRSMKVLEAEVPVSVALLGARVLPPKSRVLGAFQVQINPNMTGPIRSSFELVTNSSLPLDRPVFHLDGSVVIGNLTVKREDIVMHVIGNVPQANGEALLERSLWPKPMVMNTTTRRTVRVTNAFHATVAIQRVFISSPTHEVAVVDFPTTIAGPGGKFPPITLEVRPDAASHNDRSPRMVAMVIETDISRHVVPIRLHHGVMHLESSSGLQGQLLLGQNDNQTSSRLTCADGMHKGSVIPCRVHVFDLQRISSDGLRVETINVTNVNPAWMPVQIKHFSSLDGVFSVSMSAEVVNSPFLDRASAGIFNSDLREVDHGAVAGDFEQALGQGQTLILQMAFQIHRAAGLVSHHVLTISTFTHIYEFHVQMDTVEGVISPVRREIRLKPTFVGKADVLDLNYDSSFEHAVDIVGVEVSNPLTRVVEARAELLQQKDQEALRVVFAPVFDKRCSTAKFLANCLLPKRFQHDNLSPYGATVTAEDVEALELHRKAFVVDDADDDAVSAIVLKSDVVLETEIMNAPPVTISSPLTWPVVTSVNAEAWLTPVRFQLTELLEQTRAFVHVKNPSNITINVELVMHEADQELFYSCEDNSGSERACLSEWQDFAMYGPDVRPTPPFFLRQRLVRLRPGESSDLGPIYFFPTTVQELNTTVYIRNDLSHIEPVRLEARSGKGELALELLAKDGNEKETLTLAASPRPTLNFRDRDLETSMTQFNQWKRIRLSNVGTFALRIHNIRLKDEHPERTTRSASVGRAFSLSIESDMKQLTVFDTDTAALTLHPGESLIFRTYFHPSCFISNIERLLVVESSDGVRKVHLAGEITHRAAFAFLRSVIPMRILSVLVRIWMIGVCVASVMACYCLVTCAEDYWVSFRHREAEMIVADKTNVLAEAAQLVSDEGYASAELDALVGMLDEIESASFIPTTRELTPTVLSLLESREKGVPLACVSTTATLVETATKASSKPVKKIQHRKPGKSSDEEQHRIPKLDTTTTATTATTIPPTTTSKVKSTTVASTSKDASDANNELTPKMVVTAIEVAGAATASSPLVVSPARRTKEATAESLSAPCDQPPVVDSKESIKAVERLLQVDTAPARTPTPTSTPTPEQCPVESPTAVQQSSEEADHTEQAAVCSATESEDTNDEVADHDESRPTSTEEESCTGPSSVDEWLMIGDSTHGSPTAKLDTIDDLLGMRSPLELEPSASLSMKWRSQNDDWGSLNNNTQDNQMDNTPPRKLHEAFSADPTNGEDDWGESYFNSIRSEIGKLMMAEDGNQDDRDKQPVAPSSASFGNSLGFGGFEDGASSNPKPASFPARPLMTVPDDAATIQTNPVVTQPPSKKKAPPGFTPEDANPEESKAAFTQLLESSKAGGSGLPMTSLNRPFMSTVGNDKVSSPFQSRFSLFGGPRLSGEESATPLSTVGRIGSNRLQPDGRPRPPRSLAALEAELLRGRK